MQNKWNELAYNKLHEIKTVVGKIPAFIYHRKDDSVIRRLRIGHTYFTHSYLSRGEPVPIQYTKYIKRTLRKSTQEQNYRLC